MYRVFLNTTSCHHFDTVNLNLNWISTAPGDAVLNKDLKYKYKGTWYKFKFAENRSFGTFILPPQHSIHKTLSKEPYILSKETYILFKEPYIPSKEPYILSKEPYILCIKNTLYSTTKEPYIQVLGIQSTKPYILFKEPYILSKEPYIFCIQRVSDVDLRVKRAIRGQILNQKSHVICTKRALHFLYPKSQCRWFARKESYQRSYSISKEP